MRPSADEGGATTHPELVSAPPPGPVALAVWASALRCVCVYVALPALAPVVGAFAVLAIPVVVALYTLSIGTAVYAIRRTARDARWLACGASSTLLLLNLLGLIAVVGPRVLGG